MAAATADLATQTGLDPSTFVTVRAEQVIWSDGSLGCPEPGHMYIQVLTPGYWIQLAGRREDLRLPIGEHRPGPACTAELKPPSG